MAQTAHALGDGRKARSLAVRARLPVAGDADHDKLRIEGRQLLPAQPPLLQRPGTEILDHDVDFAGQATYDLARLVALEVERDRLLVATLRVPPQRGTLVELAPFAQRIPVLRRLDLDHFRAELSQQRAGVRPRYQRAEFKYLDARKRHYIRRRFALIVLLRGRFFLHGCVIRTVSSLSILRKV
ncbi:hypothetical protein SDC9_86672 [bioreactor metagenome]|uniref:Uncharacterized protein n=1 Tax=bioreactor metagenome TaxID=1076179 RepID=A0A644ZR04_9ZZZZ